MGSATTRVQRTRAHVLSVAREILLEDGPASLTYTTLATRSAITRQTLYRHWPSREALLADVVLSSPNVPYPKPADDPRVVIIDFLRSLRSGLSDAPTSAALLAMSAEAHQDVAMTNALRAIVANRRDALNDLLSMTELRVGVDDYAQLTGPVIAQILIARAAVTDELIRRSVDGWLLTATGRLRRQSPRMR